jgi:serine/threonine protein kinase
MPISAGTRLGPYEIVAKLGEGGMGEVYRAKDTKLNREVAIKVLPAAVAQDPERLARFRREAQVLASLNHPNIAAIYGLDEAGDKLFLVLELVEGEDLSEHLKRGSVPLGEALEIARQIALALEEANDKGIVHRDLKPANVKLTPDGKVKVLDFGLAKAYSADASGGGTLDSGNSPTMTHAATMAGMILGTAAYMSPEQARGKNVDKRADIWAFGVVLYEMLTGEQLFHGETVSDTLAAVLTREFDAKALPAAAPSARFPLWAGAGTWGAVAGCRTAGRSSPGARTTPTKRSSSGNRSSSAATPQASASRSPSATSSVRSRRLASRPWTAASSSRPVGETATSCSPMGSPGSARR